MPYPPSGGGSASFELGPEQNRFTGTTRADAETARDTYAGNNPSWLTSYNDDKNLNIVLEYSDSGNQIIVYQVRNDAETDWADNSSAIAVKGDTGAAGATGNSYFFNSISERDTFFSTSPNESLLENGLPVVVNIGNKTATTYIWEGETDPDTYDSDDWRTASIGASAGTLYLGESGSAVNSGNETLGFIAPDGQKHYMHGVEYDNSGSEFDYWWELTAETRDTLADVFDTQLSSPQDFILNTAITTPGFDALLTTGFVLRPATTGTLRVQVWLGSDDTGPVIYDEDYTVEASDIGNEAEFLLVNDFMTKDGTQTFVRYSGVDVFGGLQTSGPFAGQTVPFGLIDIQLGAKYYNVSTYEDNEITARSLLWYSDTATSTEAKTNSTTDLSYTDDDTDSALTIQSKATDGITSIVVNDSTGSEGFSIEYDETNTAVDLSSGQKITIQSDSDDIEILATSGNLTINGQQILLQNDTSGNAPLQLGNSADTLLSQVYLTVGSPEGVISASPGSLAIRIDTATPSNSGLYQLHSTGTANTPWVLIGGAGGGDVNGPSSSLQNVVAYFTDLTGKNISDYKYLTLDTSRQGADIRFTTDQANNPPLFGFDDNNASLQGEVILDIQNQEFRIDALNWDMAIESGSGQSVILNNYFEVTSAGRPIVDSPDASTSSLIDFYNNGTLLGWVGYNATLSTTVLNGEGDLLLNHSGTATVEKDNAGTTPILNLNDSGNGYPNAQFYIDTSNPDGVRTADPGALSVVIDTTTPANNGLYQLHSTVSANTPWVLIGGSNTGGNVTGPSSSVDNRLVIFDGTTGTAIKDSTNITASTDFMTFTQATASSDIGLIFNDNTDTELMRFYWDDSLARGHVDCEGNFDVDASVQFNLSGGAECSLTAGLSLGITAGNGLFLGNSVTVSDVSVANLISAGPNGARVDMYTSSDDPDGVITAQIGRSYCWVSGASNSDNDGIWYLNTDTPNSNTPWIQIASMQHDTNDYIEYGGTTPVTNLGIMTFNGTSGTNVNQVSGITALNAQLIFTARDGSDVNGIRWYDTNGTTTLGTAFMNSSTNNLEIDIDSGSIDATATDTFQFQTNQADTAAMLSLQQSGANGSTTDIHVGARNPNGDFAASSHGDLYFRANSNSFNSNMYIADETNTTGWTALKNASTLCWGNLNVQSGTTTRYLDLWFNPQNQAGTDDGPSRFYVEKGGYLTNFRVTQIGDGNGNFVTYTLRLNGSLTTAIVSLASTSGTAGQANVKIYVSRGDYVDVEVTKGSSVGSSPKDVKFACSFFEDGN